MRTPPNYDRPYRNLPQQSGEDAETRRSPHHYWEQKMGSGRRPRSRRISYGIVGFGLAASVLLVLFLMMLLSMGSAVAR